MTRQRKVWITITAILLVVSFLASIFFVFADEYVPQVVPTPTPTYVGQPFTQPGNGEVEDHVEDGSGSKEFYTVQTHNGNTFYIVIDKDRLDDNAYLLSQVDERDLMEFVEEEPVAETPEIVLEEAPLEEEPVETKKSHSWFWTILLLLIAVGCVGYWYFKMYLPNQEETTITENEGLETPPEDAGALEDFPEEEEEPKKEEDNHDRTNESV